MAHLPGDVRRELIRAPEPIGIVKIRQKRRTVFPCELNVSNRDAQPWGDRVSVGKVVVEHVVEGDWFK
jgi:hypothetical protein